MHGKCFNAQSAIKRTTQGVTESFGDSVSCRKYRNINYCGVRGLLAKTDYFSKVRGMFWKSFRPDLENVMNCSTALRFVPPGCLRKRNLTVKFANFDYACTTAPWRSLIAFCCASLRRASRLIFRVFGCSLTHTATASCSVWTSDHAHLHIPAP